MTDQDPKTATIRSQNDLFRASKLAGKHTDLKGQVIMTQGIAALEPEDQQDVLLKVSCFDQFSEDNDPHGEHDFGQIIAPTGDKVFWKMDYYAADMMHGSENPADPIQTHRVLTIMLASEY